MYLCRNATRGRSLSTLTSGLRVCGSLGGHLSTLSISYLDTSCLKPGGSVDRPLRTPVPIISPASWLCEVVNMGTWHTAQCSPRLPVAASRLTILSEVGVVPSVTLHLLQQHTLGVWVHVSFSESFRRRMIVPYALPFHTSRSRLLLRTQPQYAAYNMGLT